MNIFQRIMGAKPKLQGLPTIYDSKGQQRAMCRLCKYWSGQIGTNPNYLICAVNIPRPKREDLNWANNHLAYAYHDCPDFEQILYSHSREQYNSTD